MTTRFNALSGPTHALLRIVAGVMFMLHGGQKLLGWFGGPGGQGGTVELASLMGLAGILELVGGALIVIGLLTRPVAFVLAGEMAVAYFMAHLPNGFWPIENNGEPAALFCFIFLFLAFNGAGPWSVDAARGGDVHDTKPADIERKDATRRVA
jgi:putative oxidoreductase